jgi:hypothetical protein
MNQLPKHISYSAMSTWLDCGYKYELTKLHGLQDGHAVWLTGGTAVHLATEYYDKAGSLSMDSAYLDEVWNKAWFECVQEDEAIHGDMNTWQFVKKEDMSWWYGEGRWMLEKWAKFRNNGWTPLEGFVEKEYEVPIDDTVVKMAIDRVMTDFDGKRVLIDIKTGASSQKHPLQLAVYAWALQRDGITVDKAGFWDARTGHISEWPIDYLFSERVEDILNTFDKARKADIFLPNLSNCGRCGVVSHCKYRNGQYSDMIEFNKNNQKETDK